MPTAIPSLTITVDRQPASPRVCPVDRPTEIGRHSECAICIRDAVVSRRHAHVFRENGQWWIEDLGSANGIFIQNQRVQRMPLTGSGRIQLGSDGPTLSYSVEAPVAPAPHHPSPTAGTAVQGTTPSPPAASDLAHYKDHYFGKTLDESAGDHTMMVRRAYADVRKKQRWAYGLIIGLILLLLIGAAGVAWYKHKQVVEQQALATEVFYNLRQLEIDLIKLRVEAQRQKSLEAQKQIDAVASRKKQLEQSYDRYMDSLDVYRKGLSDEEKLIMRMAHRFGECEINMPEGLVEEVSAFIKKWQSSQRLSRVIQRARRNGYIPNIITALENEDLPVEFFYLAVQESNLNHEAVGPPTRHGIAKGMWQFIPKTASKYGLRVGPQHADPVVDPLDERHDFNMSTQAAAAYLRDIYTTDAQASGLLVMASYNWGEHRVVELIQTLPENPRERNFWQLISRYPEKIPDETYDYVFSIFSAAVIGQNPRLFGFDFDNPLEGGTE